MVRPTLWALVLLVVLVATALWWVQRVPFQERVARELVPRVEEWLGRDITVERLRYHLFPLWIELEGVTLAGPRPLDPPVATVERLYVQAELAGLFSSQVVIEEVRAEGVRFYLHRWAAGDNLPRPRRRDPTRERPFELELRGLYLERGVFVLDEEEVPLDLTARGVQLALVGIEEGAEVAVQGRVVAEEVDLLLPRAEPYSASLAARVTLRRHGLVIESAHTATPEATLRVTGGVQWRGDKKVELEVAGRVSDDLFRRLGYLEEGVDGELTAIGTFAWTPGVWGWRASVGSRRLELLDWGIEQVEGVVVGDRNRIVFELGEGRYAGGAVEGRVAVALGAERRTEADVRLAGVDLERFLVDADIPVRGIAGRLSGNLDYRFAGSDWRHGEGWAELEVEARVDRSGLPLAGTVPLVVQRGDVSTGAVRLTAPGQVVDAQAVYDLARQRGQIAYQIDSAEIGALARLLPVDWEDGEAPLWLPTAGSGEIVGTLFLGPGGTRTEVRLALDDAVARGIRAERVSGSLAISGDGVDRLRLELAREGSAMLLAGRVPFAGDGWTLALDVASWPLAEADPWLPFELPVAGPFTGAVTLAGAGEAVRGEVEGVVDPAIWEGEEVGRLQARLEFDEEEVRVTEARVAGAGGELLARGTYRIADDGLDFAISSPRLDLAAGPLATWTGGGLGGEVAVEARLEGTMTEPRLSGTLTSGRLSVRGLPVGGDEGARLVVSWEGDEVRVEGSVLGLAEVSGGGRLAGGEAALELPFRVADLGALARWVMPEGPEVTGEASGVLTVSGPLAPGRLPAIGVRLDPLRARVAGYPLVNLEPVVLEIEDERLAIRSLYLGGAGEESEIFVAGSVRVREPYALDLRVQSTLANAWFEPWLPSTLQLSGYTDLLGTIQGTVAEPRVDGQAEVRDARLLAPAYGQSVEDLRAVVLLYPDAAVVDTVTGALGGGTVRGSGRIPLPLGADGGGARFQLAGRGITVRYPEGWTLRGDAELVWSLDEQGQQLRGVVDLDRAWYLRDLDIGVIALLQEFLRHRREEVGVTDEALDEVALNLVVRAPGTVRVRNNLADLRGSADLTVRGTLGRPVLFGRAEMQQGGTIVYADNEYVVERATLTFANPYRIEPVLDLVATTEVSEYDVTLSLFGNLDRLSANFSSDPPLPDLEVLSLLLSGSPGSADSFAALPAEGDTTSAAEGLLFGQAAALLSERVGTLFGLDALRIEPLSSGREAVSSARLTVGKRLSSNLLVTYSYDPSSTQEQRFQVRWQAADEFLVILTQRGDDYAVDLLWEQRF